MKKIIYLITLVSLLLVSCGNNQTGEDKEVIRYAQEKGFDIKSDDVKNADPYILFCYSHYLWEEGRKDDAVFWYYVAQYRYRFMSSCSEHLKAGSLTEALGKKIYVEIGLYNEDNINKLHLIGGVYRIELYEVLQAHWGKTINGYGYGDLSLMTVMIDRMLDYQEKNPFNPMGLNPKPILKSKEVQAEKIQKIKDSYANQKKEMDEQAGYIQEERTKNGLENRN